MLSHQGDRSLLRDLVYYFPSKLIPAGLSFLLVIVLTHSLAPEEYGYYAIILAYVGIADTLASAWMRQSILRYYPEYVSQGRTHYFQRHALSILLMASVTAGVVSSTAMWLTGYATAQIVLMLCVLLTLIPFNFLITLYQSSRLSNKYAVVTLLQSGVQMLWILAFVYVGRLGYQFAVLAVSAGYLIGIVYVFFLRKRTQLTLMPSWTRLDIKLAKKLLVYGIPMALWVLCFQLLLQANRVIIGQLRSQEEVGIYASTYDLINGSISLIMTPFLLAVHPVIMQLSARNGNVVAIEQLLMRVVRYLLLLGSAILLLSAIVNNHLFALVLGPGYGVEGWVVPVLVAASLVGGISMYSHKGLEVTNRTLLMLGVAAVTVAMNVVLNVLLVDRFGYQASATIALFSYLFYMLASYRFSKKYIRIHVSPHVVVHIVIADGLAFLAIWSMLRLLPDVLGSLGGILLIVLLFSLVYLATLVMVGELNAKRRVLISRIHRLRAARAVPID